MITTYEHHGVIVSVDIELKGTHQSHCLCYRCGEFKPGSPDNCPIAQAIYNNCVQFSVVTPVYECPQFWEKVAK